jgi:hypothetical protein
MGAMTGPTLLDVLAHEIAALDDEQLDRVVEQFAPLLDRLAPPRAAPQQSDGWLDSKRAAAYLGMTPSTLFKLTAARTIPFEQEVPGGKLWFKPSELDAWRRGEQTTRLTVAHTSASKTLPKAMVRAATQPTGATKTHLSGAFLRAAEGVWVQDICPR